MHSLRIWAAGLILVLAAAGASAAPPLPPTPAGVTLLFARPFRLEKGFEHTWRKEHPTATQGLLLVLQVDPALVYPRQTAEPVLYVGDQTARRLNVGYPSGRVVALVPGATALTPGTPIWFGTPRLPETVTADVIAAERSLAVARGIGGVSAETIRAAEQRGGRAVAAPHLNALLNTAAPVVREYAPDEGDVADALAAQGP